jgi:hypothetical protein
MGPGDVSIGQGLYEVGVKVRHAPFERGANVSE